MSVPRVLIVDDEECVLDLVREALGREGYDVHIARDAESAENLVASVAPDLVVLDVMLPGRSGLEFARDLRAASSVPIVMLSGRADEVDRILGLEFGADDYVAKPFSPRELASRVKAILRRAAGAPEERPVLVVGDVHVDTGSRQVHVSGRHVPLTSSEYRLLLHMARNADLALSRDEMLAALAEGPSSESDERAIDVHVHNIREKLEPDPHNPTHLLTVRGFGYRLSAGAEG